MDEVQTASGCRIERLCSKPTRIARRLPSSFMGVHRAECFMQRHSLAQLRSCTTQYMLLINRALLSFRSHVACTLVGTFPTSRTSCESATETRRRFDKLFSSPPHLIVNVCSTWPRDLWLASFPVGIQAPDYGLRLKNISFEQTCLGTAIDYDARCCRHDRVELDRAG